MALFAGLPLAYLTCAPAQRQAAGPTGSAAKTITVRAGGDLQAALDRAQPGDEVVLEAGASFVGNFTLPAKAGAAFITVRSSR
ncbi:MAG TPA: hypothetical protein VG148_01190, partial [Pyrinomonadaceae bacterium]|nr:hypothetical protein [Pyrinomonadaceae bacterium]